MGFKFDRDTLEQIAKQEEAAALSPYVESDSSGGGGDPFQEAVSNNIYATGPEMLDYVNQMFADEDNPYPGSAFGGEFALPGAQAYHDAWFAGGNEDTGGFVSNVDFGGGGGGGAPLQRDPATFSEYDYNVPGAPEWWRALKPDNLNPISEYQTFANLLLPFLSPEDQLTTATNLYQSDPDQFSFYNPETLDRAGVPSEITPDIRRSFFSGDRAQKALGAFDELLRVSGKTGEDFGPGYNYLRGLADTLQDFKLTSGASQLTETQQGSLLSALDPMLAQTQNKNLGAFGAISRSFVNPFFSAGSLTGKVRSKFGDVIQPPNPRYF